MRQFIKKLMGKIGLIDTTDYSSIEYYRSQGIRIGENVDILNSNIDGCHGFLITIGNNVTITGATLLAHDATTKKVLGYSKVGKIDIGNDVFIGRGAIILPNTKIGNKVIIGSGAVVAKDIPDNSVAIGNPCRIICSWDDYMDRHRKMMDNHPVYNTIFTDKTEEDKEKMRKELDGIIGFDI